MLSQLLCGSSREMSWNTSGRPFEGQRIQQPSGGKNYGYLQSLKQYGVQTRFQSEDLSVTATAMSTNGSYHEPTTLPPPQRNRKLKLSSSDSSAIGIMRQQPIKSQHQESSRTHRRGHTMDEISVRQLTVDRRDHHPPLDRPPLDLTRPLPPVQANKQVLLPPIQGHTHNIQRSESGIDQSETMDEDVSVTIDGSHNGDSNQSCETSSDEEELISDDDNSTNEVTLQSGLRFHDPSQSSFSSLAEVDLPKLSTSGQPFVTTLVQEQLLSEHETIMTGVSPAGMSPRVNNIVRAFEIKGPLDKSLLENALHSVVKLHPILSSSFHRHNDKLYCLIPQESSTLHLETPLSYEKPPELITLARRKAFEISIISHETVNSDSSKLIPNTPYIDFDDHLSIISCGKDDSPKQVIKSSQGGIVHNAGNIEPTIPKPSNLPKLPSIDSISFPPLIRAKLVCIKPNESILILSFSRVVCDYWSSCLFVRQLSHAYSQLEQSPSHRPSLAVIRAANKRQEALDHADRTRSKAGYVKRNKLGNPDGAGVRSHRRASGVLGGVNDGGLRPSNAHFQQMAARENLILLIRPRERLWKFWESVITVRIKSTRGLSRTKVIPPVRIPNGFGEITRTTGLARPTTARFRPITARNRPQTAKRGSGFGMDAMGLESMSGMKRDIQFIKIPDSLGSAFLQALPVEYSSKIASQELLSLMCFGVYVLMLGVCSKGWGLSEILSRHIGSNEGPGNDSIPAPDPLLKYNKDNERLSQIMMGRGSTARRRSDTRRKMDVGSFLVGVNVSVRQLAPELTQGLFGPLSNIVGLRVDLSSSPTFADLMHSLWSNLQAVRCHAHYPFGFVAEDLGLVQGLPVQFSYLYPHDVHQLSNAEGFHFMESSVGVTGKALARFGSSCYMNPLSTKMDDNVQLELMMWESPRGGGVDGIFLHQTQSLRSEVVQAFSKEMLRLVSIISEKPTISLRELAAIVNPPYLQTASRSNR